MAAVSVTTTIGIRTGINHGSLLDQAAHSPIPSIRNVGMIVMEATALCSGLFSVGKGFHRRAILKASSVGISSQWPLMNLRANRK